VKATFCSIPLNNSYGLRMAGTDKHFPKIPPRETDDDNVVRQDQAKGDVRPDGPGDETAPVKTEQDKQRERRDR
jgi:hypothetical protein